LRSYHSEHLTPIGNTIPESLERNASVVGIDYLEWYWDRINDYITNNPNAFGSIFERSSLVQLPYSISYAINWKKGYDKELLCNELKYLLELGEVINAYIYDNITVMGKYELQYIMDSVDNLHLIKSKCLKILNENQR
jgi:hypothetical protein